MKTIKLRWWAFTLHRYIGLFLGLFLLIIGLTGSLLVFRNEIDHFIVENQIGKIVPQDRQVSVEAIVDVVKERYKDNPSLSLASISMPSRLDDRYTIGLKSKDDRSLQVFVNPYTGEILGDRLREDAFFEVILNLHRELLAGKIGEAIAGIVAFSLFCLCLTGLLCWIPIAKLPFSLRKERRNVPQNVSFTAHNLVGAIAVSFLAMSALTGFYWSFRDIAQPAIYAATLTPKPLTPVSQTVSGRPTLGIAELIQKADAALPNSKTTSISLPQEQNDVVRIRKKQAGESAERGLSEVFLDRYTGEVLQLKNGLEPTLADRIIDSIKPLHSGTFGGLLTRFLYVFVGVSPVVLLVTGIKIYSDRRWKKARNDELNYKFSNSLRSSGEVGEIVK